MADLEACLLAICATLKKDPKHRETALAVEKLLAGKGHEVADGVRTVADRVGGTGIDTLYLIGSAIARYSGATSGWDAVGWQRDLAEIARKPESEWKVVLTSLRASEWVRKHPQRANPRHVLKYWARYAAGDIGQDKPAVSPADEEAARRERARAREQLEQYNQMASDGLPVPQAEIERLVAMVTEGKAVR